MRPAKPNNKPIREHNTNNVFSFSYLPIRIFFWTIFRSTFTVLQRNVLDTINLNKQIFNIRMSLINLLVFSLSKLKEKFRFQNSRGTYSVPRRTYAFINIYYPHMTLILFCIFYYVLIIFKCDRTNYYHQHICSFTRIYLHSTYRYK